MCDEVSLELPLSAFDFDKEFFEDDVCIVEADGAGDADVVVAAVGAGVVVLVAVCAAAAAAACCAAAACAAAT